jgi:hypothetical protein
MRKTTIALAAVAVALFLGLGPAASAQTASTLPGIPAGQGGPDNQVNPLQGGDAPGGQNNPATNAGPAVAEDEGSSLTPWLVGAALLVVLAAGGALMARKASAGRRDDTYAGRSSVA